jgi:hypothetical protein
VNNGCLSLSGDGFWTSTWFNSVVVCWFSCALASSVSDPDPDPDSESEFLDPGPVILVA